MKDALSHKKTGFAAALIIALLATTGAAQQDLRRQPVVYRLPGMEKVTVQRDQTYKTAGDSTLKMDVYYPPGFKGESRLPAVIFVNGVGAPDLKDWTVYNEWGQMAAVSGMVAINYQSRQTEAAQDTSDLINYVRKNAASLKIDENKLAVWACSANVRVGLPFVMEADRKYIRVAVFYYGVMGESTVRQDLPVLVVRAGLDNPNLNTGIDNFVRMAVTEDVPLTFINYAQGRHAFDILDNNDTSRQIIQQTLDFMKFNLAKTADADQSAARAPSPSRFISMVSRQGIQKAIQAYRDARKTDPQAPLFQEATLNNIGYQLLQTNATKDAIEIFKLNVEAYPNSANVYDSLADAYEAGGNTELAVQNAERALALLAKETALSEDQKTNIRNSAEDKLRRLKPQK